MAEILGKISGFLKVFRHQKDILKLTGFQIAQPIQPILCHSRTFFMVFILSIAEVSR